MRRGRGAQGPGRARAAARLTRDWAAHGAHSMRSDPRSADRPRCSASRIQIGDAGDAGRIDAGRAVRGPAGPGARFAAPGHDATRRGPGASPRAHIYAALTG